MKYFIDLVNELKAGRISPVYLFFGPEGYLRREAVRRVREAALGGDADEFNFTEIDGGEAPLQEIASLAAMAPFFAERRLLVVRNAGYFSVKKGSGSGKSDEEAAEGQPAPVRAGEGPLLKYLADPNPGTCLIFDTGDQVDRRKKICKEIAKTGKMVEFAPLKPADLCAWLEKQARIAGKGLEPGAAAEIQARVGISLQALSAEIQKLITYAGDSRNITVGDVKAVTPPSPEEDVFAVVDAIGEKNPGRAMAGIGRLISLKQPPPAILGMVARQIRLILRAGEALRAGAGPGDVASRLGVHPFVAKKMAAQQRNFDRRQLITSLHRLHNLDVAVKSGRQEFLPAIEMFIMDVCREKIKKSRK